MAEGALLFGVSFALWSFVRAGRRPWLAGLAVALAFCAKQSALALLPVGLLAVLWVDPPQTVRRRLAGAALYLGVFLVVALALNPLYWRSPLGAARAALAARQDLMQRQAADALRLAPDKVLDTPAKRAIGLLAHLYFTPPSFAELSNYLEATAPAEASYLASDLHTLGRGFIAGGIFFALSLFGLVWILVNLRRVDPSKRLRQVLFLLAAGVQTAAVLALLFLPWQRYVMPVLPFACLLAACGAAGPLDRS